MWVVKSKYDKYETDISEFSGYDEARNHFEEQCNKDYPIQKVTIAEVKESKEWPYEGKVSE